MQKNLNYVQIAAIFGVFTVALGAFGAHGLKAFLNADALSLWQTGVFYQAIHSLALLGVGVLQLIRPSRTLNLSGWGFSLGILLFSGSLYGLALGAPKAIGMITPWGGLCFMWGWLQLGLAGKNLHQS